MIAIARGDDATHDDGWATHRVGGPVVALLDVDVVRV
jgi:hypothetical protein